MLNLRLIVPVDQTDLAVQVLADDPRVTNVVLLPGSGVRPSGDVVLCDVTREAASDVLGWLRSLGLYDAGSVVVSDVVATPSVNARRAEEAAPGAPDDAIVWDAVLDRAYGEARGSWSYYAFFDPGHHDRVDRGHHRLLDPGDRSDGGRAGVRGGSRPRRGPGVPAPPVDLAVVVPAPQGLRLRHRGDRPARPAGPSRRLDQSRRRRGTSTPDRIHLATRPVVDRGGRPGWLRRRTVPNRRAVERPGGVFISVTTVPAAGDFALSLALGATEQLAGSATQLGINLVGLTVAGVVTLLVQRALWRLQENRRSSLLPRQQR